jgi:hypothetical protein
VTGSAAEQTNRAQGRKSERGGHTHPRTACRECAERRETRWSVAIGGRGASGEEEQRRGMFVTRQCTVRDLRVQHANTISPALRLAAVGRAHCRRLLTGTLWAERGYASHGHARCVSCPVPVQYSMGEIGRVCRAHIPLTGYCTACSQLWRGVPTRRKLSARVSIF